MTWFVSIVAVAIGWFFGNMIGYGKGWDCRSEVDLLKDVEINRQSLEIAKLRRQSRLLKRKIWRGF